MPKGNPSNLTDLKKQKIREKLVEVAGNVDVRAEVMENIPFPVKMLLGGKNPVEFVVSMLATLPDDYIPFIVAVSEEVSEIVRE